MTHTFEDRYFTSNFERGDSFSDDSGHVILCTDANEEDIFKFSLIDGDEDIDTIAEAILGDDEEFYAFPAQDLVEQYPLAAFEGNYLD